MPGSCRLSPPVIAPRIVGMIEEWILLLCMMALFGLWLEAMRNRERALAAARRVCAAQSVQLLDETVGLSGLRLRRHAGLLQLMIRYGFEVSLNGMDRQPGHLWMAGGRMVSVSTNWAPSGAPGETQAGSTVVDLMQRLRKQD